MPDVIRQLSWRYSPASLINILYLARDSLLWRLCCYVLLLVGRLPIVGIVS